MLERDMLFESHLKPAATMHLENNVISKGVIDIDDLLGGTEIQFNPLTLKSSSAKLSSGPVIPLTITLELETILQNI